MAIHPAIDHYMQAGSLGLAALDGFVLERVAYGWRPASSVDLKLRPFANV
jgi:hypothetical protein